MNATTTTTCRACGLSISPGTSFTTPGLGEFHGYCLPNKWAREEILTLERANAELTEAVLQARDEGDDIVAWLRGLGRVQLSQRAGVLYDPDEIADAIERGEHNQKLAAR